MSKPSKLVLIVDDSEECAEMLKIALESMPHLEVRIFPDVKKAWPVLDLEGVRVGAVVTDLHLAKSNGFDLIKTLRADQRFARLPVVLVTGESDPRVPAMAATHGVSAFFAKPYSPAAVRRKLEELIC